MRPKREAPIEASQGGPLPFKRPEGVLCCPIQASLGLLGRKWSIVILRDLTFLPDLTFGQILKRNPGLTPRVLSFRLRELRSEELVEKVADPRDDRKVHYRLAPKGRDAIPILTALAAFGMKHLPSAVFVDGKPRSLGDVFPGQAQHLLGGLYWYATEDMGRKPAPRLSLPSSVAPLAAQRRHGDGAAPG
jgi:DNA-binding HxlR family transcriptional regulator